MIRSLILSLVVAGCVSTAHAASFSTENKVALQALMQSHVDRNLVDGVYPNINLKTGKITDLVPAKSHTMIIAIGGGYVLCTDFRNSDGKAVNVDFYVTSRNGRFVVFQTEIGNREPLKKLIADGKASAMK